MTDKEILELYPETEWRKTSIGKSPLGGDFTVADFFDEKGNPCPQEKASSVIIHSYKRDGTFVGSNYGILTPRETSE